VNAFISHRGNLHGSVPSRENAPDYIDEAIRAGYIVEVDVRLVENDFYLGHDFPQYKVDWKWLEARHKRLLLHLKDFSALTAVSSNFSHWHYFCHENDRYTFTNHGILWLHDLSLTPNWNTILPLISHDLLETCKDKSVYAICSDYVTST